MNAPVLYDIPLNTLDGRATTLAEYRSQVLLIVNVASRCGLTPQYAGLEALHRRYAARGLRVLGFPCNDFLEQEPGTAAEIQSFCSSRYEVSFPLYEKIRINSTPRHPLYAALIAAQPQLTLSAGPLRQRLADGGLLPAHASEVLWNFEKFLVDRTGQVRARYAPDLAPDAPELVEAIETALQPT